MLATFLSTSSWPKQAGKQNDTLSSFFFLFFIFFEEHVDICIVACTLKCFNYVFVRCLWQRVYFMWCDSVWKELVFVHFGIAASASLWARASAMLLRGSWCLYKNSRLKGASLSALLGQDASTVTHGSKAGLSNASLGWLASIAGCNHSADLLILRIFKK